MTPQRAPSATPWRRLLANHEADDRRLLVRCQRCDGAGASPTRTSAVSRSERAAVDTLPPGQERHDSRVLSASNPLGIAITEGGRRRTDRPTGSGTGRRPHRRAITSAAVSTPCRRLRRLRPLLLRLDVRRAGGPSPRSAIENDPEARRPCTNRATRVIPQSTDEVESAHRGALAGPTLCVDASWSGVPHRRQSRTSTAAGV